MAVRSAMLNLVFAQTPTGEYSQPYGHPTDASCASQVAALNGWSTPKWPEGQFAGHTFSGATAAGYATTVDITDIVQLWEMQASAGTTLSLVVRDADENLTAFTNNNCEATYASASLDVYYTRSP